MFELKVFIILLLCSCALAVQVELFEHVYFGGKVFELDLVGKNCTSFDKKDLCYLQEGEEEGQEDVQVRECTSFEGMASSINTHDNCVVVFEEPDCKGASQEIKPNEGNHEDLDDSGWNDRIISIRLC